MWSSRTLISTESVTDIQSFVEMACFWRGASANHISSPFHIILLRIFRPSSGFRTKKLIKDFAGIFRYEVQGASYFPTRTSERERERRNPKRSDISVEAEREGCWILYSLLVVSSELQAQHNRDVHYCAAPVHSGPLPSGMQLMWRSASP
jgi:hypothetical protein